MTVTPLRDFVLVELRPPTASGGGIQVVTERKVAIREAEVVGIGPEVRDVAIGQIVLINLLVASTINGQHLVAEPQILATRS